MTFWEIEAFSTKPQKVRNFLQGGQQQPRSSMYPGCGSVQRLDAVLPVLENGMFLYADNFFWILRKMTNRDTVLPQLLQILAKLLICRICLTYFRSKERCCECVRESCGDARNTERLIMLHPTSTQQTDPPRMLRSRWFKLVHIRLTRLISALPLCRSLV